MKKFMASTLISLVVIGALTAMSSAVEARPYHRGGTHAGVYLGTGMVAGAMLATPYVYARPHYYGPFGTYSYPHSYPYYSYSPAYYPPVVVQQQPNLYVEQPSAVAPQAQAQQQFWYFCQNSQTYYPHVQSCTSPWQRVMPHATQ